MKYNINKGLLNKIDHGENNSLHVIDVAFHDEQLPLLHGNCMESLYKKELYINKNIYVPIPYKFLFEKCKNNTQKLKKLKEYINYINKNDEISILTDDKKIKEIINKNYFDKFDIYIESAVTNILKKYPTKTTVRNINNYRNLYKYFNCKFIINTFQLLNYGDQYKDLNVSITKINNNDIKSVLQKYSTEITHVSNFNQLDDDTYLYFDDVYNGSNLIPSSYYVNKDYYFDTRRMSGLGLIQKKDNIFSHMIASKQQVDFSMATNLKDFINNPRDLSCVSPCKIDSFNYQMNKSIRFYKIKDINDIKLIELEITRINLSNLLKDLKNDLAKHEDLSESSCDKQNLIDKTRIDLIQKRRQLVEILDTLMIPLIDLLLKGKDVNKLIDVKLKSDEKYDLLVDKFKEDFVICEVNVDKFKHKENKMASLYFVTLLRYAYFNPTKHIADLILKMKNSVGDKYSFYEIIHAASNIHLDNAWHRFNLVKCRTDDYIGQRDINSCLYNYFKGDEKIDKLFSDPYNGLNNIFTGREHVKESTRLITDQLEKYYEEENYEGIIEIFRKK